MPAELIRIVAETRGTSPQGEPVVYQLAKERGRYLVMRLVRKPDRLERHPTADLSFRDAVALIRALKAADRGEA